METCPFSDQPCDKRKTTHITELKPDGSFIELHLCKECKNKYLETAAETVKPQVVEVPVKEEPPPLAQEPVSILATLLGMLVSKAMQQPQQLPKQRPVGKPPCPSCGMTIKDIAANGKVGCPVCWEHFKEEMKIVTQHSHGAAKHVGKQPKNKPAVVETPVDKNASIEERIKFYKLKMAKAVEVENYEAAGELKKKIAELQSQLTGAPQPTPPSSGGQ